MNLVKSINDSLSITTVPFALALITIPSNLDVNDGDRVIAAECRPLSKSVSFVVVEVKE